MKRSLLFLSLVFSLNINAQVLLEENFDYGSTAGGMVALSGSNWTVHSGTGVIGYANSSLSFTNYPSSGVGGSATVTASNGEDANRTFTSQTSGVLYASALVNISAATTGGYFFHFLNGTTSFYSRVFAKDDAGILRFGFAETAETSVYSTNNYSYNTTYLVVIKYDFANGEASLFVLNSVVSSEPSADLVANTGTNATAISAIAIRQGSGVPTVTIDGVRVANSWAEAITIPADFTVTSSTLDATCSNASDGSVSIDVAGGTSPYTFLWEDGQTDATYTGLAAGTHALNVTITDATPVAQVEVVNVTISSSPAIDIAGTANSASNCSASDGSISLVVTGGSGVYTSYLWSDGQTDANAINLATGTYVVTVTDDDLCSNTAEFNVTASGAPAIDIFPYDIVCNGGSDGAIITAVSGAGTAFTYLWSNLSTTYFLENLGVGSYTVTVTDEFSCTGIANANISEPDAIAITTDFLNESVASAADGMAEVTSVTGGIVAVEYTYVWSNAETTSQIANLGAGTYTVTVTDDNGCESTAEVVVSIAPSTACTNLFISEYIEGTSNNKAVELYNPTSTTIDLSTYSLVRYVNGSATPGSTFILSGTLAPGDVFVVAKSTADPVILAQADVTSNVVDFNGDDALELLHNGVAIDVIGTIGEDPGTFWVVGTGSTAEYTLVRKPSVVEGTTTWAGEGDTQWEVFAQNTFSNLGAHSGPSYYKESDVVLCDGSSYYAGGSNQTTAGTYTDMFVSIYGCDSIVVTNLSFVTEYITNVDLTICQGESAFLEGDYQFTADIYRDTLIAVGGCDSIFVTSLSVLPTYLTPLSTSICSGDSLFLENAWQKMDGVFFDTLTSVVYGCDSVIETTLSIKPVFVTPFAFTICDSDPMFLEGALQNTPGVYRDTLTSVVYGCDSIIETTLTVNPTYLINQSITICSGDSAYLQSDWQKVADVYYDTLSSVISGCDSVIATTLTVNPLFETNLDISLCSGDSLYAENLWQKADGIFYDTLTSVVYGCDSVVISNLTFLPVYFNATSMSICSSESVFLQGAYQNTDGVYYDTLTSVIYGCDSIIETTLNVTDGANAGDGQTVSLCESEFAVDLMSYLDNTPDGGGDWTDLDNSGAMFFGFFTPALAGSGTFDFKYKVSVGSGACESDSTIVSITVVAESSAGADASVNVCDQQNSYDLFDAITGYDAGGAWGDAASTGALTGSTFDATVVGMGQYEFYYFVNGNATCVDNDTAFVTVDVTSGPNAGDNSSVTFCESELTIPLFDQLTGTPDANGTWTDLSFSGAVFFDNFVPSLSSGEGTYNLMYTVTASGCGSDISTLEIILEGAPDAGISNSFFYCIEKGAFDLLDSLNGTPEMGGTWSDDNNSGALTGSMFDPNTSGVGQFDFTYTVSGNICAAESATVSVDVSGCTGIEETSERLTIETFPNPCKDEITVLLDDKTLGGNIQLFDITGKLLNTILANSSQVMVNMKAYESGVYFIQYEGHTERVVKQ